jgi:uncharacterized surface protein with fasciclin (FAS1) repeats
VPGAFSTLELALIKTGLVDVLNTTGRDTVGGTFFAPTNTAFKKLGPAANAFLFSPRGERFLKALLSYHIVPDLTLYSTAFYDGKKKTTQDFFPSSSSSSSSSSNGAAAMKPGCPHHRTKTTAAAAAAVEAETLVHVDLPTLLERPVAIDIIRRGPWVVIKLNAFVRVAVQDVLARDGVLQIVNSVLIPPRRPGTGKGAGAGADADAETGQNHHHWNGEGEISVEELKERLAPLVKESVPVEEKLVNWDL